MRGWLAVYYECTVPILLILEPPPPRGSGGVRDGGGDLRGVDRALGVFGQ